MLTNSGLNVVKKRASCLFLRQFRKDELILVQLSHLAVMHGKAQATDHTRVMPGVWL